MTTKIIDLIQDNPKQINFSFEFFPPKTSKGIENLQTRVLKLHQKHSPLFIDLTWGLANQTTLDLVSYWNNLKIENDKLGMIVNMHLTCINMSYEKIDQILEKVSSEGIKNIMALRGDVLEEQSKLDGDFKCGLDLVRYIREKTGDYFCLSVSGYPEGHPDQFIEFTNFDQLSEREINRICTYNGKFYVCPDEFYWKDVKYLKAKVDAGADLIITQLFFNCSLFLQFVSDCRSIGIECPILPGIMLIQSYSGFNRMTRLCKTHIPIDLRMNLDSIGDQPIAIKEFGIQFAQKMCQQLYDEGVRHFHLYTLNQEHVTDNLINFFLKKFRQVERFRKRNIALKRMV